MKVPVVIPYIHTADSGLELKHSLRSLKNITNWNGEVYILGDSEAWFSDKINHIHIKRQFGKPYFDQINKMLSSLNRLPEQFIASMDDVYITTPTEIKFYYKGELNGDKMGYHGRSLLETKKFLNQPEALDFEVHAPFLVEKSKLKQVFDLILASPQKNVLQWRSIYGNTFNPEAVLIEDKKTKTSELKQGDIISTNFYTSQLDKLFPEPSVYEQ